MKAVILILVLAVPFLRLILSATSQAHAIPDLVPSPTLAPDFVDG